MPATRCTQLTGRYGDAGVARLATAYETALLTISLGGLAELPDRRTRANMLAAMLDEAEQCTLNKDALIAAALRGAAF